jgi:hypothetical protein
MRHLGGMRAVGSIPGARDADFDPPIGGAGQVRPGMVRVVAESTKAGRLPKHRRPWCPRELTETDSLGLFNGQDRRRIAVVVTTDGRRANLPLDEAPVEVAALALLRSLLIGLDGLIGLISRRENGGSRR